MILWVMRSNPTIGGGPCSVGSLFDAHIIFCNFTSVNFLRELRSVSPTADVSIEKNEYFLGVSIFYWKGR